MGPADFDSLLSFYPLLAVHLLRQMAERLLATQEAIIGDLITANQALRDALAQLQPSPIDQSVEL